MSTEANYVQCVPRAEFNPASLTGSYQTMNGAGFTEAIKVLKLYNGSTTISIDISLDGVTSHDMIPPLGTLIVDFQADHATEPRSGSGTLNLKKGQILYGKILTNPTYLNMVGYY